jgi:hypothetical protein
MMNSKKIFAVAIISGLVGACAQTVSSLAKLDDSATSITASCASDSSGVTALRRTDDGGGHIALAMTRADDGGGKGRTYRLSNALQCDSYSVQISGTCTDCGSVLVEAGDKAVTVSVDEKGAFSYTFESASVADINLTPLSF